jgi:outer membrane protein OmpA-like peptidoglycan-associated protein
MRFTMTFRRFLPTCLSAIALSSASLVPSAAFAQENSEIEKTETRTDAEGCTDITAIFRKLPLSVIVSCHGGDAVEISMPLGLDAQGYSHSKLVHGAFEFREYQITRVDQQDRAFDNLMMLLPISGFKVKYSSSPSTITAQKEDIWILINVNGEFYNVSVVKEDPWAPVKNTQGIAKEMDARARAAIYGITFAPDNQTIVEQKSRILAELLRYLQEQPEVRVIVESHKMSPNGNQQSDQEITEKRVVAVVAWLEAHGIPSERLQRKAMGRSKPITENNTSLEIFQNDRIEIAKAPS